MIRSMTGFGRGEFSDGKRNVIAEIKTVNHRYADITVKMPKRYSFAEEKIKGIIKQQMKRGKADVSIIVENLTEGDITVNREAASSPVIQCPCSGTSFTLPMCRTEALPSACSTDTRQLFWC